MLKSISSSNPMKSTVGRLASKGVRLFREGIKKGGAHLSRSLFRSRSYSITGIPNGLTDTEAPRELLPPSELTYKPPHTVDKALYWQFHDALEQSIAIPGGGFFTLPNALSTALGGNLTENRKLVTTYLKPLDGKPFHEHDLFRFSTKRFSPRIYHAEKSVVTLTAGWQGAFYHWIYEVLPRLHLIEKSGYPIETVFVAVSPGFQKESLELMGLSSENIIDASTYDAISTPQLIVPSIATSPTPWGCHFIREKMLPKLDAKPGKRLYISRSDASRRRITNEGEVCALLGRYGFERVTLSNRTFKEQAELFHSAEIIVGPHGAGFSHLVFCDPGTPVIEFFHPGYVNVCYWTLANIMGHPYAYLLGEGERYPDHFDPHIDPDITLDLKKLEVLLESTLNR